MRRRTGVDSRRSPNGSPRRQAGVALLALLTLLTLWGLYLLLGELNTTQFHVARKEAAGAALVQARQALVARAAGDDNRPGSLPCPAIDESGIAPLLAGNHCPTYIGRLPWRTLDVGELRDDAGQLLWYALAPALRDDDSAQPINFETVLQLRLDGAPNVAAIIFAPGSPLAGQNGRPGNAVADYLDGSNSDGDQDFVSGPQTAVFNDNVLAVTRDDVFRVVNQRVLGEARAPAENALRVYHASNGSFPAADGRTLPGGGRDYDGWADAGETTGRLPYRDLSFSMTPPPGWPPGLLTANHWWRLLDYTQVSPCLARIGIAGSSATIDISGPSPPCP